MSLPDDKPLILLTNDDGYESPGIIELAANLIDDFEILLVAPKIHHSGAGRGVPFGASYNDHGTIDKHTIEVEPGKNITAYAVDGTPALSVAHGLLEIAHRKPDFCISGINFGENTGQGLHYSGTIGAAMEAATAGIPTIAISQEMSLEAIFAFEGQRANFSAATQIAKRLMLKFLAIPSIPEFLCLNVNIPIGATPETPIDLVHQSTKSRWTWKKPEHRDFDKPFQLDCENIPGIVWEEGSDCHSLIVKRNVTITPLTFSMEANENDFKFVSDLL